MFVGIDNGLKGGIAFVTNDGQIADLQVMPTFKDGKYNRVEATALNDLFLRDSFDISNIRFVSYEKPVGSKSASAVRSMADSFAVVDAVLSLLGLRREPITPQKWQREYWARQTGDDTKKKALAVAQRLWPEQSWLATSRSTKPHDGLVDAALIAEFARRNR